LIYIVIPVFNRLHFTIACLESLFKQNYTKYKIIVIDHGSTDGTWQYIENKHPDVKLLLGDESMWWTAATNLGIEWCLKNGDEEDMILTLNNDLIVKQNYLQLLNEARQANKKSIIGSVSVNISNCEEVSFAGIHWNQFTAKYASSVNLSLPYSVLKKRYKYINTSLLPGRGTLIPLKAFKELGLYDVLRFPHYAADEDFSLRCKHNGYNLIVDSDCVVYSHVDESGLSTKPTLKNIKSLKSYFVSIRSEAALKIRLRWAFKNTPIPVIYFPLDFCRLLISYLRR
jgi:GT2 family glycosyltransferase